MNLFKLIPGKFLRYFWREPATDYVDVAGICPFPKSQHASLQIASLDGAAISAQAPLADGTRGVIMLWADWFKAIGGTANTIEIALLKTGDPIPVPFSANAPTYSNTRGGMTYVFAGATDTANQVAIAIGVSIAGVLLGPTGFGPKFGKLGGRVFNSPVTNVGDVVIKSPAPYRPSYLASLTGAAAATMANSFVSREGQYRPVFIAGCRPNPEMIAGAANHGLGEFHTVIG